MINTGFKGILEKIIVVLNLVLLLNHLKTHLVIYSSLASRIVRI